MLNDVGGHQVHPVRKRPHFVISNFNTDPAYYLDLCDSYTVYDQSTDPSIAARYAGDSNFRKSKHTGHNLSDYFTFILENWGKLDDLEAVAFIKGNLVGRHVSEEYFLRVCSQSTYTFLWDDRTYSALPGVSARASESEFLEINNSWYADTKPSHYFSTYNELMLFLFEDPQLPEMNLFAPGGCYIVPTSQITNRPQELYQLLLHIVSYQHFPVEAYFVERMMHTLFTSNETLNSRLDNAEVAWRDLNACAQERARFRKSPNLFRRAVGRLGRKLILWPV